MKLRVSFEIEVPEGFDLLELSEWVRFELGQGSIPVDSELGELDFDPEQIDVNIV